MVRAIPELLAFMILAAFVVGASGAHAQAGCETYTVPRDMVRSVTLELYPPVAEPTEPLDTLERAELPETFPLIKCEGDWLVWPRNEGPVFILKDKIAPEAIGGQAACYCPDRRTGRGASPGLGIPRCEAEQCP